MEPIVSSLMTQLAGMAIAELQRNPQGTIKAVSDLLNCRHTTADVIQDIWDAVAAGNLSPDAALKATQALAADLQRHQQKPAAPPTPTYSQALDVIRQSLEYQNFQR
jgi:hypothetical protein